jgi:hypothetical protein
MPTGRGQHCFIAPGLTIRYECLYGTSVGGFSNQRGTIRQTVRFLNIELGNAYGLVNRSGLHPRDC